MNIRDLTYLVSLIENQHFGKAAEACFVSQPALSMQIQKLEKVLGIKLLERTNKTLLFTDEGINIAERARHILNQVEEIYDFAKLAKKPYGSALKIGIFPTLAPYFLPLIIPSLAKKYPDLSLYLIEEQTQNLIEKLKKGKLDAAFLALPLFENSFKTVPLFEEEFLLATPRNHAFSRLKIIKQSNLDNKELMLLEEGHCMREQALLLCQKMKATETQHFRATSIETLRHMVAAGIGMTLMPQLACDNNKNISYIPFSAPKPTRSICLTWRDTTAKHSLFKEIASYVKNILRNQKKINIFPEN
ncbi:MAG TPA: LysR substrate-binding domain-containing protein [Gammaproteobacteria bacterium]|nr:LysR substrate-binding domain-containing protein [Gammaproteobacteria bacterium]